MTEEPYQFADLFVRLISPLPGKSSLGVQLRSPEDTSYKTLKDSIELDSGYFRSGQGQAANWVAVIAQSIDILSEKSKDLEVLAWLVRGLVKIRGLEGLRDGFMLLRVFHHEYWHEHRARNLDDIGGMNWCLGRMSWLNDKLEADVGDLVLFDRQQLPVDKDIDGLQAQQQAQAATPLSYYREQESLLKQAQDQYRWLLLVLESKYAGDGLSHPVSLSRVQARLQGRALELEGLLAKKSNPVVGSPAKTVTAPKSAQIETLVEAPASRDTALAMLGAAAEYLAQTEPLSPVPHLIRRAMRWARGSLQDWLTEIIGHRSAELEAIYQTLDMKASEAEK